MVIEILVSIIGFFILLLVEHFFVSLGFFSVWAFLVLYLYRKVRNPIVWTAIILTGIVLGVTIGLGFGTYILSIGFSLFILYLIQKFIPDDHFIGRYTPYLVSFILFYLFRMVFGDISVVGAVSVIHWIDFGGFVIKSLISTMLVVLVDRLYLQLRPGGESPRRGTGIEIRRR